ncbi:MAG TPA: type II toxin-antitoxin system VapC family toxin [Pyrinomonadaceae bacterium]|jgi:toxin-antitoxin system PIN domain toxin
MILPDANLILYAYIKDFQQHQKSKEWLEQTITGGETIGLAWQVVTAFARIGTNPKLFKIPMSVNQIEVIFDRLFAHPNVKLLAPTDRHWQIFLKLLKDTNASGNLVMDAHLSALAIEHNARLASTDSDFKIFSGLDYFNPLTEN